MGSSNIWYLLDGVIFEYYDDGVLLEDIFMISTVLGYITSVLLSLSLSDSLYASSLSVPQVVSRVAAHPGCQIEDVAKGGSQILKNGDTVALSVVTYSSRFEPIDKWVKLVVVGDDDQSTKDLTSIVSGCGYKPSMRIGAKRRALLSGAYLNDRELADMYPEGVVFEVEAMQLLNKD